MKVLHEFNNYPTSTTNTTAQKELNDSPSKNRRAETNKTSNKIQQGKKLITKMKQYIKKTLTENVQAIVIYQSKKLSTKFNVKDKTEFYHQSNSVY